MVAIGVCVLVLMVSVSNACYYARSGMLPPSDEIHRHLTKASTYPVLPRPITTENNAFVTHDLQRSLKDLTGNDKSLLENLNGFASASQYPDDVCYWAFQALPPPRGSGPSILHPRRGFWDMSDGIYDQDIEWVQAYGQVAVARLHSRITAGGPVVGAMCAMGSRMAQRRCANGQQAKEKCVPAIENAAVQWPMAVSIWKVNHPELLSANTEWRASAATGHLPNIEWVAHTPGTSPGRPWNGTADMPGELMPPGMPQSPWPASEAAGWGSPKITKVVRCSDIPAHIAYNTEELFACDHLPNATSAISSVDEAYAVWRSLKGIWPPTKACADDQTALDSVLTQQLPIPQLVGSNCSVVYGALTQVPRPCHAFYHLILPEPTTPRYHLIAIFADPARLRLRQFGHPADVSPHVLQRVRRPAHPGRASRAAGAEPPSGPRVHCLQSRLRCCEGWWGRGVCGLAGVMGVSRVRSTESCILPGRVGRMGARARARDTKPMRRTGSNAAGLAVLVNTQ